VDVLDENGRVKKLIEKPKEPPKRPCTGWGLCLFPAIHKYVEGLKPSWEDAK